MDRVIQLIDRINRGIRVILALNIAVMSIIIIAQVISRYFFHNTFTWAEELARYLMVLSVFMGAGLAIRSHSLIAVEIVAESLTFQRKRILKILVYFICLAFFILLMFVGIDMLEKVSMQLSPALQLKMSIPYAAIPIGAAVLILNTIAVLLELLQHKQMNEETGGV